MNELFNDFIAELKETLRKEILEELRAELNGLMETKISSQSNTEYDTIGIEEASKMLMLSESTVYSKVSRGELPVVKRGRPLYFSKNQLEEYMSSKKPKTTSKIQYEAERALISNFRRKPIR